MNEERIGQIVRHEISVVIPTVGRSILGRCLHSISEGNELPGRLVVVDQSSNREIAELLGPLKSLGVETRYVASRQTGRASGVNRGLEQAESQFVAITDDDCLVAKDWLERMFMHLKQSPDTVMTGRVEAGGDRQVPFVVTSATPEIYRRPRLKFDALSGGNMGVSQSVLERVGLLDEDPILRCSEDGEWAYRALRAGVSIEYAPDVVVYHYGWRDSEQSREQYRNYAISCGGFYGKYIGRGDWFIGARALVHYLRELRRFVKASLTGNRKHIQMSWACLRWLIPGIFSGLKTNSAKSVGQRKRT